MPARYIQHAVELPMWTLCAAMVLVGCGPTQSSTAATVTEEDAQAVEDASRASAGVMTYKDALTSITPQQGPSTGGTVVDLYGKGFTDASDVWFGESRGLDMLVLDDGHIRVTAPPRPPGFVDVTVRRVDPEQRVADELALPSAFRYFAAISVDKVAPSAARPGDVVTVSGAGFRDGTHFVFGERLSPDVAVLDEFTATMVVPPGKTGWVDVAASNDDGHASLRDGFQRLATQLPLITGVNLSEVSPHILDAGGGTVVKVRWKGEAPGPVLGLRIGGLMASQLQTLGSKEVQALAPVGSPGPVDVELLFDGGVARLEDGVQYSSEKPYVAALLPGIGAQAGGTVVRVVGAGLNRLTTLRFHESQGSKIKVKHPGLATVVAPRGDVGTVAVHAHFSGASPQTLFHAWTWFDPQQAAWGTWGGPIEGAVNVTVLREDWPGGPVQGALVVVGEELNPSLKVYTDERGQATLSALGLEGPLNLHASAAGYGAASMIGVNARNLTLLIRKHPELKPGGGGGGVPGNIFDLGVIKGRVHNAAKFVRLPLGTCGSPTNDGQCAPCPQTVCGDGLTCSGLVDALSGIQLAASVTATSERFCLKPCEQQSDCQQGWECRAVGTPGQVTWTTRCVPAIGVQETRCDTTAATRFQPAPWPGSGATADDQDRFVLKSRLGELAIRCKAGYVAAASGEFVPLVMGITRGVKLVDDKTPVEVDVWLDTPLTRSLSVVLDPAPLGDEVSQHRRFARLWLDLEGEGVFLMAEASTKAQTRTLELSGLPSKLQGTLGNQPWLAYGGLTLDDDDDGAPLTLALDKDAAVTSDDRVQLWSLSAPAPTVSDHWAPPLHAAASGGAGHFAVGADGTIARWTSVGFTLQQSPTSLDLYAVWLSPLTPQGWAGGASGVLLRRDPVEGWKSAASPTTADIISVQGLGAEVMLLASDGQVWRRSAGAWGALNPPKGEWTAMRWTHVAGSGPASGVVTSRVWLVGSNGAVMKGDQTGASKWIWTTLQGAAPQVRWRDVTVDASKVWFVGDQGRVGWVQGGAVVSVKAETHRPLYRCHADAQGGLLAVGEAGTWVKVSAAGAATVHGVDDGAVNLRGLLQTASGWVAVGTPALHLSPMLPMPWISEPAVNGEIGAAVKWSVTDGPSAEMHRVQITNYWRQNYWTLYGKGDLLEAPLANFPQLGGWSPLPDGTLRVRVWRLHGPSLDLNHFNHQEMSPTVWRAWSMGWIPAHK